MAERADVMQLSPLSGALAALTLATDVIHSGY